LSKFINKLKFKYSEEYKELQDRFDHPLGIDVPHAHIDTEKIILQVKPKKFPPEHKWKGHKPIKEENKETEKNMEEEKYEK
jgi:hypothetical protein